MVKKEEAKKPPIGSAGEKQEDDKRLNAYTPKEFAKLFALDYQTVLRWCKEKPQKIKGVKMGKIWRIPVEEKDEFIKRQRQSTKEYLGG